MVLSNQIIELCPGIIINPSLANHQEPIKPTEPSSTNLLPLEETDARSLSLQEVSSLTLELLDHLSSMFTSSNPQRETVIVLYLSWRVTLPSLPFDTAPSTSFSEMPCWFLQDLLSKTTNFTTRTSPTTTASVRLKPLETTFAFRTIKWSSELDFTSRDRTSPLKTTTSTWQANT